MNRRLVCLMAGAFILGVAAAAFHCIPIYIAVGIYGTVCFFGDLGQGLPSGSRACPKRKRVIRFLVLCLFFAAGVFRFCQQETRQDDYASLLTEGQSACVQGEVYQKESKNDRDMLYLKSCLVQINQINYSCNQIIMYLEAEPYSIGEIICAKGKIKPFQRARNEGNFDEVSYYRSLNFDFRFQAEEVLGVYEVPDRLMEGLMGFREKIKQSYQRCMQERDAGICTAMVLGDKSVLDSDIKELYQRAGISHILAISGLHISLIGMAFYLFLRKLGMSFLTAGLLAGGGIFCYGLMSGFAISEKRAIFMFLLLLYARFRGRANDLLTSLSFIAMVMLYQNPFLLENAGFLLSFSAVAGIGIFQSTRAGSSKAETWMARWKETFGISLSIQLMTIPLTVYFFYQIPLYAMLLNLFVLPLVGVLLGFALAGGMIGCLQPALGALLLVPCHLILEVYERFCGLFVRLPGAELILGKPSGIQLLLWYLLTVFVFLTVQKWKGLKVWFVLVIAVSFICLLTVTNRGGFEMDVLDVGQGDGIYLRTQSGEHIFVDGGSTSVSQVGKYRILPFLKSRGIKSIDYWFVSHVDEDHINGLEELLMSGYKIDYLVVAERIPRDDAYQKLQQAAEQNRTEIIKMKQGNSLKGEGKEAFSIECIFPDDGYENPDRNARSMVLLYRERDFKALLTGDISSEEEKRMLTRQELPEITVFKAAHHGSKASNSAAFLQALSPELSVISCGERNRYGHPGKEAVAHMEEAGSRIYDTRYLGQIRIGMDGTAQGFLEK